MKVKFPDPEPNSAAARRAAERRAGLWPIGVHLGLTAAVAVSVFAAVVLGLWWAGGFPDLVADKPVTLDAKAKLELVKVGLAVVAGVGGLVALVVAFRRQRVHEQENDRAKRAEQRENTKLLNERFGAASAQLGHDKAAVRLAGVYALAGLADDWPDQRQTCIDVLCAYLRMPYTPPADHAGYNPAPSLPTAHQAESAPATVVDAGSEREVRATVIRLIAAHLRSGIAPTWRGHSFDFTGATLDGADFSGAHFGYGSVTFDRATLAGRISFDEAEFVGGDVSFSQARFVSGIITFNGAIFAGGNISFTLAEFRGGRVEFSQATFGGSRVTFEGATFSTEVNFSFASFDDGRIVFDHAAATAGQVDFRATLFNGAVVSFDRVKFRGGQVLLADQIDLAHHLDGQPLPLGVVASPARRPRGGRRA